MTADDQMDAQHQAFAAWLKSPYPSATHLKVDDTFNRDELWPAFKGWQAATEHAARMCERVAEDMGGVAEGPFVTDFGKHTHQAMAAGAQNCAASIRNSKE